MDIEIDESVSAKIAKPGAATAPAQMLHEIIRKLPDGSEIEIELDPSGGQMQIRAGRSKFRLGCLPVADFPDIGSGDLPASFSIPAAELRALIDRTKFAMSTEDTRYYLNGIYVHATESAGVKVLRAVSTDGHRLARVELEVPKGASGMPGVIVPRKTVSELHRLLEASGETVQVGVSQSKIRFEIGTVTLTSKLIDGTFPDYERVIPQGNDKVMKVANAEFMSAVDRVSTIASERGRAVKLNISPDKLILSVNNPDGGSATEEISVEYASTPLEIGFNARYLLDIASQLEGDHARFMLADPASPTMVRDASDTIALYVLMPMRV